MKKSRPQRRMSGKTLETTSSHHSDPTISTLALKYLIIVYPITRTKIGSRFKRSIVVGDITYSVSIDKKRFVPVLISDLARTFAISESNAKEIIFNYFNIKNHQPH